MSIWLQTEVDIRTNRLCAVIAALLNASQRSRDGVGMRSARVGVRSVKRFEQFSGLDTALYRNVPLLHSFPCTKSYFGKDDCYNSKAIFFNVNNLPRVLLLRPSPMHKIRTTLRYFFFF